MGMVVEVARSSSRNKEEAELHEGEEEERRQFDMRGLQLFTGSHQHWATVSVTFLWMMMRTIAIVEISVMEAIAAPSIGAG